MMKKIIKTCYQVINNFSLAGIVIITGMADVNAELPVPHATRSWVNAGISQQTSQFLQIDTRTASGNNSILEWESFNISEDGRVEFVQPSSAHIALNRIYQIDPSRILGRLDANGRIYLINQNGILFGSGSQVNVNTLVASSLQLNIADDNDFIINKWNLANLIDNPDNNGAAFINGSGAGDVVIEDGAQINTATGGQLLIVAPHIENAGDIHTESGQVIFAASNDRVYLTPSTDPSLRGFLVELGGVGGDVNNLGNILAERGNITLAGLMINHQGTLEATTSITENGSIRLLARDQATKVSTSTINSQDELVLGIDLETAVDSDGQFIKRDDYRVAQHTGQVTLATGSAITIRPHEDESLAVDSQQQQLSRVEITGHDIRMQDQSRIVAVGGEVLLHATSSPQATAVTQTNILNARDNSLVMLESGSIIDVSGTIDSRVAMDRNQLEVQLTGNFLRDAPLQRDGPLRNETVSVDIRQGTPLGDISEEVAANVKRDINERLSAGGDIRMLSQGGVLAEEGSTLNIAGGRVNYDAGYLTTSRLVTRQGRVVDIADASPDYQYGSRLFGSMTIESSRWGKAGERSWSLFGKGSDSARITGVTRFYDAYSEGQDAGSLTLQTHAVVLDSELIAGTSSSPYRRETANRASGGRLNIQLLDNSLTNPAQSVVITDNRSQQSVDEADMRDLLNVPDSAPGFVLEMDDNVLTSSGLSKFTLATHGDIHVDQDAHINMVAGSQLTLSGQDITLDGEMNIVSGQVDLTTISDITGNIEINNLIDVSGSWVNDNPDLAGFDLSRGVDVNAGSIRLKARQGDLILGDDSRLLANGGAWLQVDGKLVQGNGGTIALVTGNAFTDPLIATTRDPRLMLDGEMQAYALGRGGKLDITTNRIHIANTPEVFDGLSLTEAFFTRGGFADYRLTSNMGDLHMASGTLIAPRSDSLLLNNQYSSRPSGDGLLDFTRASRLPDYLRPASNLGLAANTSASRSTDISNAALNIEAGAEIHLDAGARLDLVTDSRMFVNGSIRARGGEVNLSLNDKSQQNDYIADQAIWFGGDIDVSGVFVEAAETDDGLRRGVLLAGGQVNMQAERGYVIAAEDSRINVSGSQDRMDLPGRVVDGAILNRVRQDVFAAAGDINVTAAEGFWLGGELIGQAPNATTSAARLNLMIDPNKRTNDTATNFLSSTNTRILNISQDNAGLPDISQGTALPDAMKGQGWLAVDSLQQGGFDQLALGVRNVNSQNAAGTGVLQFHGDIALNLGQRMDIASPVIRADGNVDLTAPYIFMGSEVGYFPHDTVSASGGNGHLAVNATGMLDLAGEVRIQGIDEVILNSQGDIRAIGRPEIGNASELTGSFSVGSDLELNATQVYASTLSQYDVNAANRIRIQGNGSPAPVLSAGSELGFNADIIEQGGVVKAPLGQLSFNATSRLALLDGSISSVSAEDQLIPFGSTLGQENWVYPLSLTNINNRIDIDAAPAKTVSLQSPNIEIATSATLDIQGGGDLYAWEFVPGLGGSVDHLLPENANGAFAVLPGFSAYAPQDTAWWLGETSLRMGDQIYLSGTSDLVAGVYTLLPARYALLPGASLVTPLNNTLLPEQNYSRLDGAPVVAGQRRVANTGIADHQWSAYVVESGDVVRDRSEYFESSASQFFRDAAIRDDTLLPTMPEDAGQLNIIADNSLNLAGQLLGDAAQVSYVDETGARQQTTGRSSQVNIAGDHLRVVNAYDSNGGIQLLDDALNDFGAASLLLGGVRERNAEGTLLTVSAFQVDVETGAELLVPDILLASTDGITLASGAQLRATSNAGAQDERLIMNGDGALLRASSAAQVSVDRRNESANPSRGVIQVEAGAIIEAGQAITLDASRDTLLTGELRMVDGSLNLGASRISLGSVTGTPSGLVLNTMALNQLAVDELVLTSRSSVDVYGDIDLAFNQLAIEAGSLDGYQAPGEQVRIRAESLKLGNPSSYAPATAPTGNNANLLLSAGDIELDDGTFQIRGFDNVTLHADWDILTSGQGRLALQANGAVILDGRITGGKRSDYVIDGGNSALSLQRTSSEILDRNPALAASLRIEADSIVHQGLIDMASGQLGLHATGTDADVLLAADSVINLSGIERDFGSELVYTPGGQLTLVSDQANVVMQAEAVVDVSGGSARGDAGGLDVTAAAGSIDLAGQLLARHGDNAKGGSLAADARTLVDFSALNQNLNTGGFNQRRHLRQRQGDMMLNTGEMIQARDVSLQTDAGSIHLAGRIDASGEQGGQVHLAARDDIAMVSGAVIDAYASGADERGGRVFIEAREGMLNLATGAGINVSGTNRGGEIHLRAPRTAGNNGINISSVAAGMQGFERIDVEGYRSYDMGTDSLLSIADLTTRFNEASSFMVNDILGGLDFSVALDDVHLRPGIEFLRNGDLGISGNLDFFSRRYSNNGHSEAGILSVRASGNVNVNGNLSDGFAMDPYLGFDRLQTGESWSYRLVAGSDLTAAAVMVVGDNGSDLTLASNRKIRTGTGDIELAVADRLVLNSNASLYTAGENTGRGSLDIDLGVIDPGYAGFSSLDLLMFPQIEFPEHGGDIQIRTGGDISGNVGSYLASDWLQRMGGEQTADHTVWGIVFQYFNQGIGALGGGDIDIEAAGNVDHLAIHAPVSGRQIGAFNGFDLNEFTVLPGGTNEVELLSRGNIDLHADGNIEFSMLHADRGSIDVSAGGAIGQSSLADSGLYVLSADTRTQIVAASDIVLQGANNTSLQPLSIRQAENLSAIGSTPQTSFFSTYSADSSLSLFSTGGDVVLRNTLNNTLYSNRIGSTLNDASRMAINYPSSLVVAAIDGDITLGKSMTLWPSPEGDLSLLANGDIRANNNTGFSLDMLDMNPAAIPGWQSPINDARNLATLLSPGAHATTPLHMNDDQAIHIVARQGDIAPDDVSKQFRFVLPESAEIVAGQDIHSLSLILQNMHDTDISLIQAGRDIRHINGAELGITSLVNEIRISGPGQLQVLAGRNIDLGDQKGIVSIGNNDNSALPDQGADILMMAGLGEQGADYAAFADHYFTAESEYRQPLMNFMTEHGYTSDDFDAVLNTFKQLPKTQQAQLVTQVFFNEVTESAIRAAQEQSKKVSDGEVFGYTRGMDAIATLFPGTVSNRRAAESGEITGDNQIVSGGYTYDVNEINSSYSGNVSLISSTVQAQDDGSDIAMITPGGFLNVGLSVATGNSSREKGIVNKGNGDIAVLAHSDVAVNQSRIQALNGGDMTIWSTWGDIDAGRGAKSALNIPPPRLVIDPETGSVTQVFDAVVQGSGIRSACFDEGCEPGKVVLAALAGAIDAGDAGINAEGAAFIATDTLLNSDNIQVSGESTGVPTDAVALGIDLGGLDVNGSGADAAENTSLIAQDVSDQFGPGSVAIISVEVMGLGNE